MVEQMIASCLSCDFRGTVEEGALHDSDEHIVVYNYDEPEIRQFELAEIDEFSLHAPTVDVDPDEVDFGCGCG